MAEGPSLERPIDTARSVAPTGGLPGGPVAPTGNLPGGESHALRVSLWTASLAVGRPLCKGGSEGYPITNTTFRAASLAVGRPVSRRVSAAI